MEEQIQRIKELNCVKHIKIYKMHLLGLKNKEIAGIVGTSIGRVWNVLRSYKDNQEKIDTANSL